MVVGIRRFSVRFMDILKPHFNLMAVSLTKPAVSLVEGAVVEAASRKRARTSAPSAGRFCMERRALALQAVPPCRGS